VATRPTWPPFAASVAVLFLANIGGSQGLDGSAPALRRWAFLFAAASLGGLALIAGAAVIYLDPSILPDGTLREFAEHWRSTYADGVVVYDRPGTFLKPTLSWWGFARLEIARLGYFFWFLADGFSPAHRWLNIIIHIPLYSLALVGATVVVWRPRTLSPVAVTAGLAALMYLLIVDVYHATTFLDFDWRYRAPAYPWIILLAAIGTNWIGSTWRRQQTSMKNVAERKLHELTPEMDPENDM